MELTGTLLLSIPEKAIHLRLRKTDYLQAVGCSSLGDLLKLQTFS